MVTSDRILTVESVLVVSPGGSCLACNVAASKQMIAVNVNLMMVL